MPLPPGFIAPCLPTKAPQPPSGDAWLHEIKHDGFRVIARKEGGRVRLYSRPGNDLTYRFALNANTVDAYCGLVSSASIMRRRSCRSLTFASAGAMTLSASVASNGSIPSYR